MKVVVDTDACEAHGDCTISAPDIFELGDDDDVVTVKLAEPPKELHENARDAAEACPVEAITIEE